MLSRRALVGDRFGVLSGEDDLHSEDGRGGEGQHVSLLGWKCLQCNSATNYLCHQG